MKKTASIILALCVLCGCFCSCGYFSTPSAEEMREAMKGLLPDAYAVTYIVYGPGLDLDEADYAAFQKQNEESPITNIHYVTVNPEKVFPGCDTEQWNEEKIRAATRRVFAKSYADEILEYAFESTDQSVGRYNTVAGAVLRIELIKHEAFDMLDVIYPETLKVIDGNAYACTVEVDAKQNGEDLRVKIQMVFEDGKWLFNGAAY